MNHIGLDFGTNFISASRLNPESGKPEIIRFLDNGQEKMPALAFYNEHGVMKKVMTCGSFRMMHDRVIPVTYKMETVGKKDRYTQMNIRSVRFNSDIPASVFTLQNLKRK